jgi:hypothetical protein
MDGTMKRRMADTPSEATAPSEEILPPEGVALPPCPWRYLGYISVDDHMVRVGEYHLAGPQTNRAPGFE